MELEFAKMSGAGNDFIVIDNRRGAIGRDVRELTKQLCRRRMSIGADGLILVGESRDHGFRMRYFNADGSEADMCGNGGRCVARFASELGITGREMEFESRAGLHRAAVHEDGSVRLMLPAPRAIIMNTTLTIDGETLALCRVNTGVPHTVIEVEDVQSYPVVEMGRLIRYHSRFAPEGTNVDFVTVKPDGTLRLRTYERGVEDETLACGTGAVATALMMAALDRTGSPAVVMTQGGKPLIIDFYMSDHGFCDVSLSGDARIIYWGKLQLSED